MELKTDAKHIIKNVEVVDIADEGKAIAKVNEFVVLLRHGVPGDVVDIHPKRWRKNFVEGEIVRWEKFSDKRDEPVCNHFGTCGGCKWQNMKYEWQLHYKQRQVEECFRRIAKVTSTPVLPIMGSDEIFFYRNKLEFTFSGNHSRSEAGGNLGFHLPGRFDLVLDIDRCHLQKDPSDEIRLEVRRYAIEKNFTFYDYKRQAGFLRNLIIRTTTTGEVMVLLSFFHEDEEKRIGLLSHLKEKFPGITSLLYVINPKGNDTIFDREVHLFSGKDHLVECIGNLKFKIGPKSFFQVNAVQAVKLFRTVIEFAGLTRDDSVYDLYTGNGGFAMFASPFAKKIAGIEYVDAAIKDARINAAMNGITNVEFFSGDIRKIFTDDFMDIHGKPDVIITDPPRAGMDGKVIEQIRKAEPKKIVYISCNPATQARDVAMLADFYAVEKIQPVDMFPHTHHVESVALLIKK